jgi:hypothetical protein
MMAVADDRGRKLTFFLLGIALPLAGLLIWMTRASAQSVRKEHIDHAHDITVEDSFPASDPPSAW